MFYESVAAWLRLRGVTDVVRVTDVKTDDRNAGYCETCSYEYTVLVVTYVNAFAEERTHEETMDFAELVKELSKV